VKFASQFGCGCVMCQNLLMVFYSTKNLLNISLGETKNSSLEIVILPVEKNSAIHLAFLEHTERKPSGWNLKTAFFIYDRVVGSR